MLFSGIKQVRGFSLIEVLASLLLLAGLISIIVQLSYGNTRRVKKARQMEKVASLLERKMLEIEEEFKGAKMSELLNQDEGQFEDEKGYFWNYTTQSLIVASPEMLLSLLNMPETEMNIKMFQVLTSVLSETVVELKLTVRYEGRKGRSFRYSLVSYFINYENAQDFIFKKLMEMFPQGQGL